MYGGPVLRALALGMVLPAALDGVAELGRDLDLIARNVRKCLAHDLLVRTGSVHVPGVEERDSELDRALDQVHALAAGDLAPPRRAQRPCAESDLRALEVGFTESAGPHGRSVYLRSLPAPGICLPACRARPPARAAAPHGSS